MTISSRVSSGTPCTVRAAVACLLTIRPPSHSSMQALHNAIHGDKSEQSHASDYRRSCRAAQHALGAYDREATSCLLGRVAADGAGHGSRRRTAGRRVPVADQDLHAAAHRATPTTPRSPVLRARVCEGLGRWFLVATPVVAGLLYGPLVHFFAREARGHGVPGGDVRGRPARRADRSAGRGREGAGVRAVHRRRRLGRDVRGRSCRSVPRWARPSAGSSAFPRPGCGCWSPAGPPGASRRPSTHRWPASSSRWS